MLNRRRTDSLPGTEDLPADPIARARMACDALVDAGFETALALQVIDPMTQAMLCAAAGRIDPVLDTARGVAEQVASTGRALQLVDADDSRMNLRWRFGAVPCGSLRDGEIVVVVADPTLTQREAQAVATWIATPVVGTGASPAPDPCCELARSLAAEFSADIVVFSLFAQSGMLLNLHVRSGAVLRTWRCPVDTVWGEAARHNAAFVLGELHMHPGAESLSSLGMTSAAVVGLENGSGVAVGSVGLASREHLDIDIAHSLLERAPILGAQVMQLRGSTPVPRQDTAGAVDLVGFAARVGCRRFALYSKQGNVVTLVSAHADDGSVLVSPPDPFEEQLVVWAAEKGIAVASDDAAAVMIGDDTVLYAQDPARKPMECLRLALQDLRNDPYGGAQAA
jgi:hypothetical protein